MQRKIIIVFTVILVLPLILYYFNFGTNHLSCCFSDWSEFSTFYSLFVSLFNGVILVFLTWKIHQENMNLNKPLIIFTIQSENEHKHKIKNIGNGPAINIEIFHSKSDDGWDRKITGLTLAKGEEFELKITGQRKLGAIYSDQSNRKFMCYMIDTFMKFEGIDAEFSKKPREEKFIWEIK